MRPLRVILLIACLTLALHPAHPQSPPTKPIPKDPVMTRYAEGTFDVKVTPLPPDDATSGTAIGRYAMEKKSTAILKPSAKAR